MNDCLKINKRQLIGKCDSRVPFLLKTLKRYVVLLSARNAVLVASLELPHTDVGGGKVHIPSRLEHDKGGQLQINDDRRRLQHKSYEQHFWHQHYWFRDGGDVPSSPAAKCYV